MAFSQVQTVTQAGTTGNTQNLTISATSVNNLVVVTITLRDITETCTSVTDDKGNTYVLSPVVTNVWRLYQAYGMQVTGGTTVITVNYSSTTVFKQYAVDEYSGFTAGATNSTVFDTSQTGSSNSTSLAVSTLTPAATGELIVASMCADNVVAFTAGTNYTKYATYPTQETFMSEYRLSSASSETAPATIASSLDWAEIATAFKVGTAVAATLATRKTLLGVGV